jgi:antitoxin (DNA-binding transcriptional repressor) of toxin-antitoxin stability system
MKTVTIHVAKSTLSQLLAEVEKGEEIILARGKDPIAKLVPIQAPKKKRTPGSLKGQIDIGPAFFEPLPPEELDAWDQ